MRSFSGGLLFVSYLSNHIGEIFKTYSDRYLDGKRELWRSHNLHEMQTMFTTANIMLNSSLFPDICNVWMSSVQILFHLLSLKRWQDRWNFEGNHK